jgi:hypothetical protein
MNLTLNVWTAYDMILLKIGVKYIYVWNHTKIHAVCSYLTLYNS